MEKKELIYWLFLYQNDLVHISPEVAHISVMGSSSSLSSDRTFDFRSLQRQRQCLCSFI